MSLMHIIGMSMMLGTSALMAFGMFSRICQVEAPVRTPDTRADKVHNLFIGLWALIGGLLTVLS